MENQEDIPQESSKKTPDLRTLSELDFGPSWAGKSSEKKSPKRLSSQKPLGGQSWNSGKVDRRSSPGRSYSKSNEGGRTNSGERKTFKMEERRNWNQTQRDNFQPVVNVSIYPQDKTFEALIRRLRSTVRTYQLFEIAHLILEKPERYAIVVQNKSKKDEKPNPLYFTVMDYLPFETEDDAISHFLNCHLDSFFDMKVIDIEPPKGNFQMVNRCTITGELLGPPNYHSYQGFLKRHYASRISNMSFDRFVSKIESVKEQESIDAWVESMKKGVRYKLKEPKEGEHESFESLEAVRSFLLQNRKEAIISSGEYVRFAGQNLDHLPKGAIRRSIEMYIEHQLRFPLDTANNIRGRLRRHNFTVYKKGSKGVAYVCAVKRKFRDSTTVFAPSIQELIDFIEKNPNVLASRLPRLYLGIDTEKQKPAKLEINEFESPEKQVDVPTETSDTVNEPDAVRTSSPQDATTSVAAEATFRSELSEEKLKKLNQLMLDLRWLIAEGYVTEYGDGRLFASPPMQKPKSFKRSDATETKKKTEPENTDESLLTPQVLSKPEEES